MSLLKNAVSVIFIASILFSGPSAFAKPKTDKATPTLTTHPKMWLVSFTFTMTDFARKRLATPGGIAPGISQLACGSVSGLLDLNDHMNYIWKQKGFYGSPRDPGTYHILFQAAQYNASLVDVTADDVRDIFGADAISDVKEIPYDEFQRQQQAKERIQVINALKLSAGNVPQTAVRLGITEADLRKKMSQYGIVNGK